jgi:hypothetical protein
MRPPWASNDSLAQVEPQPEPLAPLLDGASRASVALEEPFQLARWTASQLREIRRHRVQLQSAESEPGSTPNGTEKARSRRRVQGAAPVRAHHRIGQEIGPYGRRAEEVATRTVMKHHKQEGHKKGE